MPNYDFVERLKPQGYFDKEDDSFLEYFGLVRGSYNVLISDEGKTVTRKGMTLVGQAGSAGQGVKSSDRWETNTGRVIDLRSVYDKLQVLYNTSIS